ncbi:hypothetical protein Q8A67_024718 [Cirrhinus molitorella]|uniref:Uncharacterized protein n=1 Tax=Cirrhinus molitorella TaxID=172907 RepID=A0AA88P4R8_9TELE|nr:hypothetical protein Q8A67_024718 [Cirrhinus molitorella]
MQRVEAPPAPLAPSPHASRAHTHTHRLWRSRRSAVGWILTTKEQRRERRGGRQPAEVHKSSFPDLEEETFTVRGETTTLAFQNIKSQRSPRLAAHPGETRNPAEAVKRRGGLGRRSMTLDFQQGSGAGGRSNRRSALVIFPFTNSFHAIVIAINPDGVTPVFSCDLVFLELSLCLVLHGMTAAFLETAEEVADGVSSLRNRKEPLQRLAAFSSV